MSGVRLQQWHLDTFTLTRLCYESGGARACSGRAPQTHPRRVGIKVVGDRCSQSCTEAPAPGSTSPSKLGCSHCSFLCNVCASHVTFPPVEVVIWYPCPMGCAFPWFGVWICIENGGAFVRGTRVALWRENCGCGGIGGIRYWYESRKLDLYSELRFSKFEVGHFKLDH